MRCTAVFLMIGGMYLLSLGPVVRYFGSHTRWRPVSTATGLMRVRGVTYPYWVGFVYYPAFAFREDRTLGSLYDVYLQWWDPNS